MEPCVSSHFAFVADILFARICSQREIAKS